MRKLEDLGVSKEDGERLLRGLHEGRYNLLLGAGARLSESLHAGFYE